MKSLKVYYVGNDIEPAWINAHCLQLFLVCLGERHHDKDASKSPYKPPQGLAVRGIGKATFLLSSAETLRTIEFHDTPVYSGASDGEYRAEIQMTQDSRTGNVGVYVKARSLQGSVYGRPVTGPTIDTSSAQADDTSCYSFVKIGECPALQPSKDGKPALTAIVILAILILPVSIIAARKRKPSPNSQ